jgi:hypothetical protein
LTKKGYDDGKTDRAGTTINVLAKPVVESTVEFRDGVCSGYLTYYDKHIGRPLTSSDVYHFLMQNIIDTRGTDQFNAGYCTGWIEALIEDRRILSSPKGRENM